MKNYILFEHEAFMESIGNCEYLALDIIEVFLRDIPQRSLDLSTAINDNSPEVVQLAHAVKGITSTLRITKVAQLANEIETAAKNGDTSQLAVLYEKTSTLLMKSITEIEFFANNALKK